MAWEQKYHGGKLKHWADSPTGEACTQKEFGVSCLDTLCYNKDDVNQNVVKNFFYKVEIIFYINTAVLGLFIVLARNTFFLKFSPFLGALFSQNIPILADVF